MRDSEVEWSVVMVKCSETASSGCRHLAGWQGIVRLALEIVIWMYSRIAGLVHVHIDTCGKWDNMCYVI